MINRKYLFSLFFILLVSSSCKHNLKSETSGGWVKYQDNPVLGGNLGTIFDVSVLKVHDGVFRMYCSWRPKKSIALSESKDGLTWSKPNICLQGSNVDTNWECDINRPVVIEKSDTFRMWYTGQSKLNGIPHSWIGYAISINGKDWKRVCNKPVLWPDENWEKVAVMCPDVIWDEKENIYKMWYSAGDQYEPDAIGYATSFDGINWKKYDKNPIFSSDKTHEWEQSRATACQVIKRKNDYLMFYIGFKNIDFAQIGMARSKDGISNWERCKENPIIKPGNNWDKSAVYKPYAIINNDQWLLYYNGRYNASEQIGIAIHKGLDLGF